jgi:hypothetical protein
MAQHNAPKTHANLTLSLATATLFASLTASAAFAYNGPAVTGAGWAFESVRYPSGPCRVIYLSDKTAGKDLLYKEGPPFSTYAPLPQLPAADDGLGLYAATKLVYAGAGPNTINVYPPCSPHPVAALTTAGAGVPLSIAVDPRSNVYATELGTPVIDWFNSVGVDTPSTNDTPRSPGLPYYLAVDHAGNIYTSGWDPTNSFEQIDVCTPGMASCAPCEGVTQAPSWPGGIAIDQNQHIIVNNEIGSIWVYGAGCGTLLSQYVYSISPSPHHFSFTGITLNTTETAVIGAKQFDNVGGGCVTPFCMDAQYEAYNAFTGTIGAISPPNHTAVLQNQQPGAGIAVWPPGPI